MLLVLLTKVFSLPMSENNFQWTRALTQHFTDLLQQHPCLWQTKNNDYKNKIVRTASLNVILKEFIEAMNCVVTQDEIIKKLHTLRGQFRKEMNDMKASHKSGAGTKDLYVPKLWCFDASMFLAGVVLKATRAFVFKFGENL